MNNEQSVFERLKKSAVVAVLVIDSADDAEPVVAALMEGGITALELTLRTPIALTALRIIRDRAPEMLAGIGTIITPDQVSQVVDSGASFGVAPGMNARVVAAAIDAGLPFAPGITTPSDIEHALEFDRRILKFFPAEASGGLPYLQNIAAPYQHLGLQYVPLGGVSTANCEDYMNSPLIAAIGGSWLASRDLIRAKNWDAITARAKEAIAVRDRVRAR